MIKENCFSEEWFDQFKRQEAHKRIDKIILEKMIYALHLLENIKTNGLHFVFKGGTSLVLLLEEGNRFSIDIDIISDTNQVELEGIFNKVLRTSRFTEWELEEHRSYMTGVPKAHYKFLYPTKRQGTGTILLDILVDKSIYPEVIEKPLVTKWIEIDEETWITLPSIDAITGDKLTAFAPNTIGVPYFKGVDRQPFAMNICKQLFDLQQLFNRIDKVQTVAESFRVLAEQEIAYRKLSEPNVQVTPEAVLFDTIHTCIILAKRGGGTNDEKIKFSILQKGIRALGSGFLMTGNFRTEDAVSASAKVAYLSAKILTHDYSPITYYEEQKVSEWNIVAPEWTFLNRLKKLPEKSAFFYWYQTVDLLSQSHL